VSHAATAPKMDVFVPAGAGLASLTQARQAWLRPHLRDNPGRIVGRGCDQGKGQQTPCRPSFLSRRLADPQIDETRDKILGACVPLRVLHRHCDYVLLGDERRFAARAHLLIKEMLERGISRRRPRWTEVRIHVEPCLSCLLHDHLPLRGT